MPTKLGRHHPTIRRLRALRRDPRLRREQAVFVAEGIHLAGAALESRLEIELALVAPRLGATPEGRSLLEAMNARGLAVHEADPAVHDAMQDARSPQPVLMLVRRPAPPPRGWPDSAPRDALVVVAVGLQDPGNLGGLCRTADAAGADAFFIVGAGADPFHPRAVRATMGSIFRVPYVATELEPLLDTLGERGFCLVGTHARTGEEYARADFRGPLALFFGNEGAGLPPALGDRLDRCVRVPMRPGVESLSVGAAAAVILFAAARQRDRTGRGPAQDSSDR